MFLQRWLFIVGLILLSTCIGAESDGSGIRVPTNPDAIWLVDADRLMDELLTLDADLHALIGRVENPESRNLLICRRNEVRRLIYELAAKRNDVLIRIEERLDRLNLYVDAEPN